MTGVPRTLAVANQKGGVAKTTTVASLGAALVELGQRVLLVDLDPQACLTFSLGIDPEDLDKSIYHVLLGGVKSRDVLVGTDDGPDLLPATIELATADIRLAAESGPEQLVRTALRPLRTAYDWILIDCPPTLGLLTVNGLSAATDVLIPLQCETLAHRGVGQSPAIDGQCHVSARLDVGQRGHGAEDHSLAADTLPRGAAGSGDGRA